jgi:hypothetical protein
MEEIYILSDGTSVDVSNYSEFEKTKFLLKNPGAKKSNNTAKGAATVFKKKPAPSLDSSSEKSSSESKSRFRLPREEEYEAVRKSQGIKKTPTTKRTTGSKNDFYTLKEQLAQPSGMSFEYNQEENKKYLEGLQINNPRHFGIKKLTPQELDADVNIQNAISSGYITQEDLVKAGLKKSDRPLSSTSVLSQKEVDDAARKINTFRTKKPNEIESYIDILKIDKPYLYEDFDEEDDFASELYDTDALVSRNFNMSDFNGFLKQKGFKDDYKRFLELGLDKKTYGESYDPDLSTERRKLQYLNMYINDNVQRDIKKQKIDYEKKYGVDPDLAGVKFKQSKAKNSINLENYQELLVKTAPKLTAKMVEIDRKNLENYESLVKSKGNVGAGKFLTSVLDNGWNGFTKAISGLSSSAVGILPGDYFEGVTESIRENKAINEMLRGDNLRYVSADGNKTRVDGIDYIASSDGQVYDITNKINVSNILPKERLNLIVDKARKEQVRDKSISGVGTSYQTAEVVGDLFVQLALTRGMGNGLKAVGGFTEGLGVLGKTKNFLRSIPIKRSMSEAIIAQSTLGFSKGYEDTLKAAREVGIRDSEAKELASLAAIETGAWYAITAPINPQTKTTDMLFGKAKNEVIENALNAYVQTGKKGFLNTLRNYGKNFLNVTGEGFAELFQENVQQLGETYIINKDVNELAGKKILKDTMSLKDFIDTSLLSFIAGSIIPGAGAANTQVKKSIRSLMGMQGVDRFNALGTLASNKDKVSDLLSKQVAEGIYTQEQVDNVLSEIDAYNSSINRMPGDISAEAAEDILEDVSTLSKLEQQKKETDKSFHAPIDEQIDEVRSRIERRYYDDVTTKRTDFIKKVIEKGGVANIEFREFDKSEDLKKTLMDEFKLDEEKAQYSSEQMGTIIPYVDEDGNSKKVIIVNNDAAANSKVFIDYDKDGNPVENRTLRGYTVSQHEFLHGLIFESVRRDPEAQRLIGKALVGELVKLQEKANKSKTGAVLFPTSMVNRLALYADRLSEIQKKLKIKHAGNLEAYNQELDAEIGSSWEEALTLFSDAISEGQVQFEEDVFTKIGDMLRRLFQRLGLKKVEFRSGKDVYNFIKDYNRAVEKGDFGSAVFKAKGGRITINKESLRKETKDTGTKYTQPSEEELNVSRKTFSTTQQFSLKGKGKGNVDYKEKVNSFYDKNKWANENYLDSTIFEVLQIYKPLIISKAKGYGYDRLPDYSEEDMYAETQIALIPVIRNFNKEFFQLREEYKKELNSKGLKENTPEFNKRLEEQDEKGYKGKKGVVKENPDLNAWINLLLPNKMKDALKTGNVTSQKFTQDIDDELFKESSAEGFDFYEQSEEMLDDIDAVFNEQQEYEMQQNNLAVLLKDPIFGFTDEDGNPIEIETIPFGVAYTRSADDPIIPANRKLKAATDPQEISNLEEQLRKLKRGLELQSKPELTPEEKEELKSLKSFKSYDLTTGGMVNTFEAFSTVDVPAKIISNEISREIVKSPNIETLEYRNFKEKLSLTAQTLARRMTFKNSESLNKFMYDNWELIYGVINNPIDPVSGESSYASKKLPPRLKELDADGNYTKRKEMNRTLFLQSYFGDEDTKAIIEKYSKDPKSEISKLEDTEVNEKTGKKLWPTAYFDRRTALMELFGDVLVLQEARRLLRDPNFLESIKERNVNLYNDLKDDIKRDAVLNNMAKGKSDIVKYSLRNISGIDARLETINDRTPNLRYSINPDEVKQNVISISTNPINKILPSSSIEESIKYSLSDITSKKLEGYNKKYEVHFNNRREVTGKFPNKSIQEAYTKTDEQAKNDYVKVLMLSDLKDQTPGTKLHTFKSYEDIVSEVKRRIDDIVYNMTISPDERIARSYSRQNPYLYDGSEINTDNMSDEEVVLLSDEIRAIRLNQFAVLNEIINSIIKNPKYSLFKRYLILQDIIGNRYSINYNDNSINRNRFKPSEFSRTRLVLDVPLENFLEESFEYFNNSDSLYPLSVYNAYKLEKEGDFIRSWENNRFLFELESGNRVFVFKQSDSSDDHLSLQVFASRNQESKWCTGQAIGLAASQLRDGDFYIISDKNYKPIIAIRTEKQPDGSGGGGKTSTIGEIVGVHQTRDDAANQTTAQSIYYKSEFKDLSDFFEKTKENSKGQDIFNLSSFILNIPNVLSLDTNAIEPFFIEPDLIGERINFEKIKINLDNYNKIMSNISEIKSKLIESGVLKLSINTLFSHDDTVKLDNDVTMYVDEDGRYAGTYIDILNTVEDLRYVTPNGRKIKEGANDEDTDGVYDEVTIIGNEKELLNGTSNIRLEKLKNAPRLYFQEINTVKLDDLRTAETISLLTNLTADYNPLMDFRDNARINSLSITAGGSAEFIKVSKNDIITDDFFMYKQSSYTTSTGRLKITNAELFIDNIKAKNVNLISKDFKSIEINTSVKSLSFGIRDLVTVYGTENLDRLRVYFDTSSYDFNLDDIDLKTSEYQDIDETTVKTLLLEKEYTTSKDKSLFVEDVNKIVKSVLSSKSNNLYENIYIVGSNINNRIPIKENGKLLMDLSEDLKIKDIDIKYSLAETMNSRNSVYMTDANIDEQLFIAKIIDKAVTNARIISNKPITFKVPDLKEMNDKAKSFFLIDKVSQGFNDFEFLNKKDTKGELTEKVLNVSDIKYSLASSNANYNSNLEVAMNEIIQENKGIDVSKKYSPETAKNLGKNIGRYEVWIPPSDDDLLGLLYRLAEGKGKTGEAQFEFFNKNIIQPYSDAMLNLMHERQRMYADWTNLINKKYKGISKRLKKDSGYGGYTIDQAIRVYLWDNAGYEIPGLDARDVFNLKQIVRTDKTLRDFARDVSHISKQPNGYIEPNSNWGFGSIVSDIHNEAQKANRKKYLEHFQKNVDKIFSKDNLSKIEALYGRQYVIALKNMLNRLKTGSNRAEGSSDNFLNWINGATGVTMFFNVRSAVLQTVAMVNFVNISDNNPLKVSARMLDVKQFMKDYSTLWNSDYLKDRRSGLMSDIAEAELAQIMNDPINQSVIDKFKAANAWILKQGYLPTRMADSFAIAFGGASFYRNRINTYMKQGDTEEDAAKKAMRDFYETAESSQQSADVSKISMNQASTKGRLIFAFQNTPLQYGRLMTRAAVDIIKGRGDFKTNVAKIVYYGAIQNIFFNMMQSALFWMMFDDDDEKNAQEVTAATRAFNGALDTILRGSGLTGAAIATLKNVIIKWYEVHGDPKAGGEVVVEALNISPPLGIKARKLLKSYKAVEYNADEIKYKGFSIDNTYALEAVTAITSAGLNLPADRVYQKGLNVNDAITGDFETWQRVALILGYSKWNLGAGNKDAGKEPRSSSRLRSPDLVQEDLKQGDLKQ